MTVIYEQRTYCVTVGKMPEVIRLYSTLGWPAIQNGSFAKHLLGYFISDTGELHQLMHLWRFDSDADRRQFWTRLLADPDFAAFVLQVRPLLRSQRNQLLVSAPWGPAP